jgi:hypothetical protein
LLQNSDVPVILPDKEVLRGTHHFDFANGELLGLTYKEHIGRVARRGLYLVIGTLDPIDFFSYTAADKYLTHFDG